MSNMSPRMKIGDLVKPENDQQQKSSIPSRNGNNGSKLSNLKLLAQSPGSKGPNVVRFAKEVPNTSSEKEVVYYRGTKLLFAELLQMRVLLHDLISEQYLVPHLKGANIFKDMLQYFQTATGNSIFDTQSPEETPIAAHEPAGEGGSADFSSKLQII